MGSFLEIGLIILIAVIIAFIFIRNIRKELK